MSGPAGRQNTFSRALQMRQNRNREIDRPTDAEMKLAITPYSNREINEAGKFLADWMPGTKGLDEAMTIIASWRATHSYPMRIVKTILRQRAMLVDSSTFVYGRMKRLASIRSKLSRIPTMAVTTMQDIGGCRAVLENVDQVNVLANLPCASDETVYDLMRRHPFRRITSLMELKGCERSYIYFETCDLQNFVFQVDNIPSQYVRRMLADSLGKQKWDWRQYGREPEMFRTVSRLIPEMSGFNLEEEIDWPQKESTHRN